MEDQAEQYNQDTHGKKRPREEATVKQVVVRKDHNNEIISIDTIEIPEDAPASKKERAEESEKERIYKDYLSRFEDLKVFIKRRMPPENKAAMEYVNMLEASDPDQFLAYLKGSVLTLYHLGGIGLLFGRICSVCGIEEKDFIDRSVERPELDDDKKKAAQLCIEKVDLQMQIRYILDLIPQLEK